jgi:hypothetical protein
LNPVSQGAVLESRFKRLRVYNAIMGTFHLAQAGAIFALANDFALPVTTNFLHWMPETETLETVTETLYDLRIGPLVGIFLLISAIAHYTVSSPGVFNWYVQNLKKGINYARWYEYSLSASLMVVIIAMLSGVYDVGALVLIFTCNAAMIFFGLMMELHNQTTAKTNWTAFTMGCIVGFVPWIVIAVYFFGSLSTATETIPTFVYYILASLFVLFFSFALNMFLQYKKVGPWKDYLFGESMYILLSLVAKSALAWQVFGGTLARDM